MRAVAVSIGVEHGLIEAVAAAGDVVIAVGDEDDGLDGRGVGIGRSIRKRTVG